MRKSELIEKITHQQENLSLSDVTLIVEQILACLSNTLAQKGRIEVRGFGNLMLHYQAAREAHNPKTNQKIQIAEKYKVRFKMGKELKKRLNENID